MFSWPISLSVAIIHVDLWMSGKCTDSKSNIVLIHNIFDMSQFVVVVPVNNKYFTTLAENIFQYVLMKFGVCHLVVIDNGTPFKRTFVIICKYFDINYDVLVKRNYNKLTVEYFHRFLNITVKIAMKDRQSNDVLMSAWTAA